MPATHRLLQIAIGGGDDPYVHGLRPAAAHGFELALLEYAEQLDLRLERQVPNLVEEDGPTVGKLEAADPPIDGAGEGALDVSEEFALDEAGRDGAAVDLDQGALPARAAAVDGTGDQLLASSRLSGDEHGGIGGRHLLHLTQEGPQRRAAPDDLVEVVFAMYFLTEIDALTLQGGFEGRDLLVSFHVLDGQRYLVGDFLEEGSVGLRVLMWIDAGYGQGADALPVDHERDDDIGAHAVAVSPLLHREFALCVEVSAKEQALLAKDATHVAIIDRHLEAEREVTRRQGALEREQTQYIALGVVEKDGGPIKGHHTSNSFGN